MKRIVIFKDKHFPIKSYLISPIADRWRNWGYHVIVTHLESDILPEADVAILHIDQTVVADKLVERLSKYRVVLNRKVLDISKSRISANILERQDTYAGPVIIKTTANCGGVPEMKLKLLSQSNGNGKVETKLSWEEVEVLNHKKYPIVKNMDSVPPGVWRNKMLVAEKFLPEREGDLFYLRYYIFLGQSEWASRFGSKEPVVKFSKMETEDTPVPVPEELKALRERLGFDYGRFDYGMHNGSLVLYDVNKTIGGGRSLNLIEAYANQLDNLAEGIKDYFAE